MNPTLTIRPETAEDIPSIRAVVHAAFERSSEADLVDALRRADALNLSLVADIGSRIVGHVAFSPITIGERHPALALAPLAVVPDCQRQGIGAALTRWSLDECRRPGHGVVIVLGGPAYHGRFGSCEPASLASSVRSLSPQGSSWRLSFHPDRPSGYGGMVCYQLGARVGAWKSALHPSPRAAKVRKRFEKVAACTVD